MTFHRPEYISEFLEWSQSFCETTSLGPVEAALIYSELCNIATIEEFFDMLVTRDKYNTDRCALSTIEEILAEDEKVGDDDLSIEDRLDRFEWYGEILRFHGFDQEFVDKFCVHLSPSSEETCSSFTFKKKNSIKKWFQGRPYAHKGAVEDINHFSLVPYDPTFELLDWYNLFKSLGFEVRSEENLTTDRTQFSRPIFSIIDNNNCLSSVFSLGDCGFPYESGTDRTTRAKIDCSRHFNFIEQLSSVMLLWDKPVVAYIDGYSHPIVYYGIILSDDFIWRPLVLNNGSVNLDEISGYSEFAPGSIYGLTGDVIRLMGDKNLETLSQLFSSGKLDESKFNAINLTFDVVEM